MFCSDDSDVRFLLFRQQSSTKEGFNDKPTPRPVAAKRCSAADSDGRIVMGDIVDSTRKFSMPTLIADDAHSSRINFNLSRSFSFDFSEGPLIGRLSPNTKSVYSLPRV